MKIKINSRYPAVSRTEEKTGISVMGDSGFWHILDKSSYIGIRGECNDKERRDYTDIS